jgi:DNA polymerase type B, organellar and viral
MRNTPLPEKPCIGCGRSFVPVRMSQERCKKNCSVKDTRRGDRHNSTADRHKSKADRHTHRSHISRDAPFIGIDGEGGGTNQHGQQDYLLVCARDEAGEVIAQCFKDNNRLTTVDCLEFILSLPRYANIVGFFFDYDVTQILRDLPPNRLERLLKDRGPDNVEVSEETVDPHSVESAETAHHPAPGRQLSPYTYVDIADKHYGIEYVPKQHFTVVRMERTKPDANHPQGKRKPIPRTARTVNEVGGFFQSSFVKALKDWNVGDADILDMIELKKAEREHFNKIDEEIHRYCEEECRLLAELMTKFRVTCNEATTAVREELNNPDINMVPSKWRGAGWLAGALHESCKTPLSREYFSKREMAANRRAKTSNTTRKSKAWNADVCAQLDPELEELVKEAYYGGRFEISCTGHIPGPVYEYDINSAYPAAMMQLPCPVHTKWKRVVRPKGTVYIAELVFEHPSNTLCAGFPFRTADHRIRFPLRGRGVYWSVEIEAARKLGAKVEFISVWEAEKCCDCHPYSWVEPLYNYRKSIDKGTRGKAIKLGLNALYGKLAQRKGARKWHDIVSAGLITAIIRAKLMEAVALDPAAIVMLATDAIYSTRPLNLDIGAALGTWEPKIREQGLFVAMPGIYWAMGAATQTPKTRGIPRALVQKHADRFEAAWDNFFNSAAWNIYINLAALTPALPSDLSAYSFGSFPDDVEYPSYSDPPQYMDAIAHYVPLFPEDLIPPTTSFPMTTFIGLRLALHRNDLTLAGRWTSSDRAMDFTWKNKRIVDTGFPQLRWEGIIGGDASRNPVPGDQTRGPLGYVRHFPYEGSFKDRSTPYDPKHVQATEIVEHGYEFEAQPDRIEILDQE